jgi:hypothetical protein
MRHVATICALVALAPNIAVCDETFRCGSYLVSTPLSVSELIQKCGQPSSKQTSTGDVRTKVGGGGTQKIGTTTTEVWRYDRGSGSFPMIVTVVDGVIQSITRGE